MTPGPETASPSPNRNERALGSSTVGDFGESISNRKPCNEGRGWSAPGKGEAASRPGDAPTWEDILNMGAAAAAGTFLGLLIFGLWIGG